MPNTAPTGYPTLIGLPKASVTPEFPPRLVTLFLSPSIRSSLRQLKLPRSNVSRLTLASQPLFVMPPIFCDWVVVKPCDGGNCTGTIALLTFVLNTDASMPSRSPKKPASKPKSVSVDFSGPSLTLPGPCGMSAGVFVYTATGWYVWNESNGPGALPAVPSAARNLRLLIALGSQSYLSRL